MTLPIRASGMRPNEDHTVCVLHEIHMGKQNKAAGDFAHVVRQKQLFP